MRARLAVYGAALALTAACVQAAPLTSRERPDAGAGGALESKGAPASSGGASGGRGGQSEGTHENPAAGGATEGGGTGGALPGALPGGTAGHQEEPPLAGRRAQAAGASGTGGGLGGAGGALGGHAGAEAPPGPPWASDDFSGAVGDVDPMHDFGKDEGTGWATGWMMGEHRGDGFFFVTDRAPLGFGRLKQSGNYMGHRQWDLGRHVNLATAGLAAHVDQGFVAKAGATVWLSVLVRVDGSDNPDPVFVTLHHGGLGYHYYNGDTAWAAGVFPRAGINKWTLWTAAGKADPTPNRFGNDAAIAHTSNRPMTIGQASLLVIKVELSGGASDRVSLYADPPALGGSEPATPDATAMTGQSARFAAFAFAGGGQDLDQASSFDEVRIGPSFASVTPVR